jgi:hypothetical protein
MESVTKTATLESMYKSARMYEITKEEEQEHAFTLSEKNFATSKQNEREFLIDSRCSEHMVPPNIEIESIKYIDVKVAQADGTKLRAVKEGTPKLQGKVESEDVNLKLARVLVVEGLSTPPLSVNSMIRNGMNVHFFDKEVIIEKEKRDGNWLQKQKPVYNLNDN